jgi:uncharacterized membrane protein
MFNDAHLHLLINHAPVFAMLLASALLLACLFTTNRTLHMVALSLVIVAGIGAVAANFTGEPAFEQVAENLDEASTAYLIGHEQWGERTYLACVALGVLALIGFVMTLRVERGSRLTALVLLLFSGVANAMLAITATLGGSVMHPEIRDDGFGKMVESKFLPSLDGEEDEADDTDDDSGRGRGRGRGGDG